MYRIAIAIILMLALAVGARAQDWNPREVAVGVATQIEENFYDEARAAEIGSLLRERAASGTFDDIGDPFALAASISSVIEPFDGHFRVNWAPTDTAPTADARGRQLYDFGEQIRRSGYGFRQVSILPGNIGYVDMTNFANIDFDDPADPARRAVDAALALVADADAIIIDLRDNGGGAPSMVGYLTSAFTPPGAEIYNQFQYRGGEASEAPAIYHPSPRLDVPLFVLTSGRTGSAGEAFPYTVQAAGRATVVGERTYGAANPGGELDAGHGFTVFVAGGSPRNPITGSNWEREGVQPDIAVDAADALAEAQRIALRALSASGNPAYRNDVTWALSALSDRPAPAIEPSRYIGSYEGYTIASEDGALVLSQGRRPRVRLVPLGNDLFYRSDNPLIRYRFASNADGAISAIETMAANGSLRRAARDEDVAAGAASTN